MPNAAAAAADYNADTCAALIRRLDRLGVRHPSNPPMSTQLYPLRWDLDEPTQLEAFLLESLLTALSHSEPLIALRATFQAYGYFERFRAHNHCSFEHDCLLAARNRCEAFIAD